eukprot:4053762-Pyramimonas_sp.AAC.1
MASKGGPSVWGTPGLPPAPYLESTARRDTGDSRPNASSRASSQESADISRLEAEESTEQRSQYGAPPPEIRRVALESAAVAAADAVKQLCAVPTCSTAAQFRLQQFRLHTPLGAIEEG